MCTFFQLQKTKIFPKILKLNEKNYTRENFQTILINIPIKKCQLLKSKRLLKMHAFINFSLYIFQCYKLHQILFLQYVLSTTVCICAFNKFYQQN